MRKDVFQDIADPTIRAIIALIALHAVTPNALAKYFDMSRQAVLKQLKILTECELIKQEHHGEEIIINSSSTKARNRQLVATIQHLGRPFEATRQRINYT